MKFFKGLWDRVSPYLQPILKLFGGDEGESLTSRVQQAAAAQRERNAGAGGGTGEMVMAGAGVVARNRQAYNEQAFGINPGALLQAPGLMPEPGSLLRQSPAAGKAQLDGELRILFEGAPPGMRAERATSSQSGVTVTTQNVGRRTMGGTNE
ncbi:hypothetical protein D3C76_1298760 [compost metagenome]